MRIHDNCHRAVVNERHLHVGTEGAGLDGLAEQHRQVRAELLVHWHGKVGLGGMDVARTVSLARACHQRELADNQNAHLRKVGNGTVHHPLFVVEDSHCDDFAAEVVDILVCVAVFNSEQQQQSLSYLGFPPAFDVDTRRQYSLYY